MGEPQLIIARQGQYLPAEVRHGKIEQVGTSALSPRGLSPFGLQERVETIISTGDNATKVALAALVHDARDRASRLDADFFLVGEMHHRSAYGEPGYTVFSADTQAYVVNSHSLPKSPTD